MLKNVKNYTKLCYNKKIFLRLKRLKRQKKIKLLKSILGRIFYKMRKFYHRLSNPFPRNLEI
ncbi:hypothetical protein HCMG_00216 [Helicobacter canadensis MIT 98-5491]|nr:hypothetical protein HCMG_00216 [Helicobacter canadensis MIT 98-5491]